MIVLREHWLTFSTAVMLLVAALFATIGKPVTADWVQEASRDAGFVLTNLTISGAERTSERDILARLDIDTGMPLLAVDLKKLQARIEALPWVRRAAITRILPGDLNIKIEERVPFALWQRGGKLRLIDTEGVVITRRGLTAFSDLLMIVGDGGPTEVGRLYETLRLAPDLADRIKTVVRVGMRRWDLLFENGIRVKLPDDSKASYTSVTAWKKFAQLEAKHDLLAREVSVIDLRMNDRLIMRVTPAGRRRMNGKEWAT